MTAQIVLLGAASQVGYRLLPLLNDAEIPVLAVSRQGRPEWASESAQTRWLRPEQLQSEHGSGTVLVSTGPLTLAVETALRLDGIAQIVALSSASVEFKSESPDPNERELMAKLLAAENDLTHIANLRSIPLTIFRPALVYGSGLDDNLCRLARWIKRIGWMPVAGAANGLRQPIYSGDLAALILEAIRLPGDRAGMFLVAGCEQLSFRSMVISVFVELGKKPRLVELPVPLYRLLLRIYSWLRPNRSASPEMADRQNRDLLVHTDRLLAVFDFKPGGFRLRKEHLLPPKRQP